MSNKNNQLKSANQAYQQAIELTTKVINKRASNYKNLVIIVTVISLGTIVWAIVQLSWKPLVNFSLLLPICGSFLLIDTRQVNKWQAKILSMWSEQQLDLNIFYQVIFSIKTLPTNTLKSLMQTIIPENSIKNELPVATRKAIFKTIATLNNCQSSYMVKMILIGSVILGSLALALVFWSGKLLLVLLITLLILGLETWFHSFRLSMLKKKISRIYQNNNFELASFLVYINSLEWDHISLKQKNKLLNCFKELKR